MNNSDSESLILIDEFGTGTDPIEGASLAMSIIIKLIELKSLALMTTHYSAIKNFASNTTGVQNASMEFDGINLMPTYKLKIGIPGSSKAFEISKRLGMSDEIINRAKNFIDKDMLNVEVLQERLEKQLKEIEKEKTELNKKEMENQIIRNELENAKFQLNEKIKELDQKIRQDKTDFLKEARKEFENIVHEIKISNSAKDKIKQGKQLFDKIGEDLKHEDKKNHKSNKTFEKGDEVHVISKDVDGIIVDKSNNEGQYLVQVGILKINFDSEDLSLNKSKIKKEKSLNYYSDMPKAQITIDLRGYRYEDAEKKIDKFIEEALINKTEIIKIIHGKGTGALRNCIQDYLKNCPFVVEYNYEKLVTSNETNFGVTVARLRR